MGFTLTDLDREIMVERGYICQCAGSVHKRFSPTVTDKQYCPNCQAGIQQYGTTGTPAGASCKFHASMTRDKQESPENPGAKRHMTPHSPVDQAKPRPHQRRPGTSIIRRMNPAHEWHSYRQPRPHT